MHRGNPSRPIGQREVKQAEDRTEQRAEDAAVDANPIEMRPRATLDLMANLVVGELVQILLDHSGDLALAPLHRVLDQHVEYSDRHLIVNAVALLQFFSQVTNARLNRAQKIGVRVDIE